MIVAKSADRSKTLGTNLRDFFANSWIFMFYQEAYADNLVKIGDLLMKV